MAYTALYRKYRPRNFDEIVEQQHIVKALKNSVRMWQIAHAYLFCGTRGTGKTSMAHILSRAINCPNPEDGNPCNKCEICTGILSGSILDVLELDAASNNSVDNIREIRDEVIYSPSHARYKVYIIDEVHMLSTGAFNALLKTLEEPPPHVVFILATTEPHRLPATVLSRCQRYDFHRISAAGIMKQLQSVALESGLNLDERALKLIALKADGALRDALSLLDRCSSIGSKTITLEDVLSVAGIVDYTFLSSFAESIINGDTKEALDKVSQVIMEGKDIRNFTTDSITYYRNLLVYRMTGDISLLAEVPDQVLDIVKKQAEATEREHLTHIIKELSALETSLRWAVNPRILLEVTIIKLCENMPSEDGSLLERISLLERRVETLAAERTVAGLGAAGQVPDRTDRQASQENNGWPDIDKQGKADNTKKRDSTDTTKQDNADTYEQVDTGRTNRRESTHEENARRSIFTTSSSEKDTASKLTLLGCWQEILNEIKASRKMALYSCLLDTGAYLQSGGHSVLIMDNTGGMAKMIASSPENTRLLESLLSKKLGKEIKISIKTRQNTKSDTDKDDENNLIERAKDIAEKLNIDSLEVVDE
jgi:DNA polymerase-3 subunit gamma/tau